MTRRILILSVAVGCGVIATGCDTWKKHSLRPATTKEAAPAADPSFERPKELNNFFHSSRPGAMSSEGREIERSLGADR
jgi:hypothetical protein